MKRSIEEEIALGLVLTRYRATRNLTQEKLEAASGVSARTIQRVENGYGLGAENLDSLCSALGTTADVVLAEAAATQEQGPVFRCEFTVMDTPGELLAQLRRIAGIFQVGPEGEHAFNEHIGGLLIELSEQAAEKGKKAAAQAQENADYLLRYCARMGFRLFISHRQEELVHEGKRLRRRTSVIIAARQGDARIRETPKGARLDYVMDRRKQVLHHLFREELTSYDWMEHQLISKSDGEERVRYFLRQIHDEIRGAMKNARSA